MPLSPGQVHVTTIAWDRRADTPLPPLLSQVLSPEERRRRDRYIPTFKKRELTVGHALLRAVLSREAGLAPSAWRFREGEHGRPFADNPAAAGLSYNLTHCEGLVACALARGAQVGVDAEPIATRTQRLVHRFYHPWEIIRVEAAPPHRKAEVATAIWVLKEAVLKATGKGLSVPLPSFAVDPETTPPTLKVRPPGFPERCALSLHHPTDRHVLAVALVA